MRNRFRFGKTIAAFTLSLAVTSPLVAQTGLEAGEWVSAEAADEALPVLPEVEIKHDASELMALVRPLPDPDYVNTALVFNRPGRSTAVVTCVAYNSNGRPLGRAWVKVAGNGLGFISAADLSNGRDFIGSARCRSSAPVVPQAFIAGLGLTDTGAKIEPSWNSKSIRFPLVASF